MFEKTEGGGGRKLIGGPPKALPILTHECNSCRSISSTLKLVGRKLTILTLLHIQKPPIEEGNCKLLEKIGKKGFETLSKPDCAVIDRVEEICSVVPSPIVYEVGVGIGATTIEIAKRLDGRGEMHLFSRQNCVRELQSDLAEQGYSNVRIWGSPSKTYSGYHFEMACAFEEGKLPKYHLAYLDGGHVLHLDGATVCLLKELALPGASLVLDDIAWSLKKSPTLNPGVKPETAEQYDPKQIEARHVDLARRCFLDPDPRFKLVREVGGSAIYNRRKGMYGFFTEI